MVFAPTSRIGYIHLIAQHVPYRTRLDTRFQRLYNRKGVQFMQLLVLGKTSPVAAPENLFEQFPELPFPQRPQPLRLAEHTSSAPSPVLIPLTRRVPTTINENPRESSRINPAGTLYSPQPSAASGRR